MKIKIILSLFLISLFIQSVYADVINASNVTIGSRIYYTETYAVPFELFLLILVLGFVFLTLSIVSERAIIPFATVAFMLFLASAYSAPMVGFINYETATVNGTYNVIPYVSFVGQPWMMYLLYGFALIAFLNIWRGVLYSLKMIRERSMEDI